MIKRLNCCKIDGGKSEIVQYCSSEDVAKLEQAAAQMAEALELDKENDRSMREDVRHPSLSLHIRQRHEFMGKRDAALAAYREAVK